MHRIPKTNERSAIVEEIDTRRETGPNATAAKPGSIIARKIAQIPIIARSIGRSTIDSEPNSGTSHAAPAAVFARNRYLAGE